MPLTEWESKTRNRVLRALMRSSDFSEDLWKKGRRIRQVSLIAALATTAAERLEAQARELRACAQDLGYKG